jgi:hypothetical protein
MGGHLSSSINRAGDGVRPRLTTLRIGPGSASAQLVVQLAATKIDPTLRARRASNVSGRKSLFDEGDISNINVAKKQQFSVRNQINIFPFSPYFSYN